MATPARKEGCDDDDGWRRLMSHAQYVQYVRAMGGGRTSEGSVTVQGAGKRGRGGKSEKDSPFLAQTSSLVGLLFDCARTWQKDV